MDPFCSIIIAGLIAGSVLPLVRHSMHVVMQGAPALRQRDSEDWLAAAGRLPGVHKIQRFRKRHPVANVAAPTCQLMPALAANQIVGRCRRHNPS